ncbi:MAG: NAD(P)H-hydrate dehydratase [Candidatus Acidiferrales bacterium]
MKVLTAEQMKQVDLLTTERFGIPSLQLMENAGTRFAEFVASRFSPVVHRNIIVLCGKGNNGGDGLVIARKLREMGAQPAVFLLARLDELRGDAATNLRRWQTEGGALRSVTSEPEWLEAQSILNSAYIIVDALLGTGLRGPVEGLLAKVISAVNQHSSDSVVLSVDIPSGLSSNKGEMNGPAIEADFTITFTAPKIGQLLAPASERVGRLFVESIGSPWELIEETGDEGIRWLEPMEIRKLPRRRKAAGHKGDYGHVLVAAGSLGKAGAAVLSGWAALRVGAGLVTVATSEFALLAVASQVPELMTALLPATDSGGISLRALEINRWSSLQQGKSVLAVGPGLGTHSETQRFARTVVTGSALPVVLDADGLNAFAGSAGELNRRQTKLICLTPHPGEMARLLGCSSSDVQERRIEIARHAAAEWNVFVVLKGNQSVLAEPHGSVWVNSTGNPGMATAGTGDVLTGVLAGLIAQMGGARFSDALTCGVYLHGLAGDLASAEFGEAPMIASDIIHALPRALAQLSADLARF